MSKGNSGCISGAMPGAVTGAPLQGRELISLAQKLARDAEHHAILSASLASQADRLMVAGLEMLEPRPAPGKTRLPNL